MRDLSLFSMCWPFTSVVVVLLLLFINLYVLPVCLYRCSVSDAWRLSRCVPCLFRSASFPCVWVLWFECCVCFFLSVWCCAGVRFRAGLCLGAYSVFLCCTSSEVVFAPESRELCSDGITHTSTIMDAFQGVGTP
jgi:hypothetical protein